MIPASVGVPCAADACTAGARERGRSRSAEGRGTRRRRTSRTVSLLACVAFAAGCGVAQDAAPVADSSHHVLVATIPFEFPGVDPHLSVVAEPVAPAGRAPRLLVGIEGAQHVLVVDLAPPRAARAIEPSRKEFTFGASVAWVCDLDGDGELDIAIGASREHPGDAQGCVFLVSSASGRLLREIDGIESGDHFGCSLDSRGTTLVVGCPGLGEGGGYACIDLRANGEPIVQRIASGDRMGLQVLFAGDGDGPGARIILGGIRGLECHDLAGGELRWSYWPPAGYVSLARGTRGDELVLATRPTVNSASRSEGRSMLGLLSIESGKCSRSAEPGGACAVADGRGLVLLDAQGGLESVEWAPRERRWIAPPERAFNPYWSDVCAFDAGAGRRWIAWARARQDQPSGPCGELRLYEVRP